jgi:hypothetical protein
MTPKQIEDTYKRIVATSKKLADPSRDSAICIVELNRLHNVNLASINALVNEVTELKKQLTQIQRLLQKK